MNLKLDRGGSGFSSVRGGSFVLTTVACTSEVCCSAQFKLSSKPKVTSKNEMAKLSQLIYYALLGDLPPTFYTVALHFNVIADQ